MFHYEPKYYDPQKERLEQLYEKYGKTPEGMKRAEDELASEGGNASTTPGYVPGRNIRGAFSRSAEDYRKAEGNAKVKRIVMLITVLAAMVVAYFLAQGLVKLI